MEPLALLMLRILFAVHIPRLPPPHYIAVLTKGPDSTSNLHFVTIPTPSTQDSHATESQLQRNPFIDSTLRISLEMDGVYASRDDIKASEQPNRTDAVILSK